MESPNLALSSEWVSFADAGSSSRCPCSFPNSWGRGGLGASTAAFMMAPSQMEGGAAVGHTEGRREPTGQSSKGEIEPPAPGNLGPLSTLCSLAAK